MLLILLVRKNDLVGHSSWFPEVFCYLCRYGTSNIVKVESPEASSGVGEACSKEEGVWLEAFFESVSS